MKNMLIAFLFCTCILLPSCIDNSPYKSELTEILRETSFNKKVLSNIDQYEIIGKILEDNMDMLLTNNDRGLVFKSNNDEGVKGFYPRIKITNDEIQSLVVDKISPVFMGLLDKEILKSIHVNKDGLIMFHIKSERIQKYSTNHNENIFNQKRSTKNAIAKDTLIRDKWYYNINLDRDYGW